MTVLAGRIPTSRTEMAERRVNAPGPAWEVLAPMQNQPNDVSRVRGESVEDRLWGRVVEDPNGCWVWTGTKTNGYGSIYDGQRTTGVHRVAYELVVGKIPEGLHIDHLCRNRACCNPAHLEPVTSRENILRGHGAPANNARKTHCINGHPLSGDNLEPPRASGRGGRRCVICRRDQNASRYLLSPPPPVSRVPTRCRCCDGSGTTTSIAYARMPGPFVDRCPRCDGTGSEPAQPKIHMGIVLRSRGGNVWVVYGEFPNDEWGLHRLNPTRIIRSHYAWQIIHRAAAELLDERRWSFVGFGDAWDHDLMETAPLVDRVAGEEGRA